MVRSPPSVRIGGIRAVRKALRCLLSPESVAEFPSWETLPHERLSPRADTVGRRVAVMRRLAHPGDEGPLKVVVAPVRAILSGRIVEKLVRRHPHVFGSVSVSGASEVVTNWEAIKASERGEDAGRSTTCPSACPR